MAYLKKASSTITEQTSDSPIFTTPALGTPASGVISACTSSGQVLTAPVLGTPASGAVTNLTGVLPVEVTGGSGLNAVPAAPASVTGGNTTYTHGSYTVHVFTSDGVFLIENTNKVCDVLMVGGGGSGGSHHGSAGAAGGLLYGRLTLRGSYTILIGAGGY